MNAPDTSPSPTTALYPTPRQVTHHANDPHPPKPPISPPPRIWCRIWWWRISVCVRGRGGRGFHKLVMSSAVQPVHALFVGRSRWGWGGRVCGGAWSACPTALDCVWVEASRWEAEQGLPGSTSPPGHSSEGSPIRAVVDSRPPTPDNSDRPCNFVREAGMNGSATRTLLVRSLTKSGAAQII